MASIPALSTLRVSRFVVPKHNGFPNCSIHGKPLIIYHTCFASSSADNIEQHLRSVGVVRPAWRFPMYREHHYHSTTHEVLVVARGSASLCFGGPDNPDKIVHEAQKGDVMVVPAGLSHAMLENHGGFSMIGSYPAKADQWDHCTGGEGKQAEDRIRGLEWFEKDPVYGDTGPVLEQ